ncbi:hypothetical protein NG895_12045 [Aeoliella sp. ICT_H6.2]|uniref:Uncharacterized protein n=1 Tax=Aeoliella straminimaris TaxID=2954799 RepID=A0A9X2JJ55_9BACT|nr:hypothetical protein [Aeoliella straminimaris]MCO6044639.1 hypothetical protein [Aeoliella straminimaris]
MNNIQAKFYLPKLSDSELANLLDDCRHFDANCPTFSRWLTRELRSRQAARGMGIEDEPLQVPFYDWSNAELAETLVSLDALSKTADRYRSGELFDELQTVLVAIVASRLNRTSNPVGSVNYAG